MTDAQSFMAPGLTNFEREVLARKLRGIDDRLERIARLVAELNNLVSSIPPPGGG